MTPHADLSVSFLGTGDPVEVTAHEHVADWSDMDTEEHKAAVEELDDWVNWIVDQYGLDARVVPECWPLHRPLVSELSALHQAWLAVYRADGDVEDLVAPLRWHEQFAAARVRLADWAARTGCRTGEHRP